MIWWIWATRPKCQYESSKHFNETQLKVVNFFCQIVFQFRQSKYRQRWNDKMHIFFGLWRYLNRNSSHLTKVLPSQFSRNFSFVLKTTATLKPTTAVKSCSFLVRWQSSTSNCGILLFFSSLLNYCNVCEQTFMCCITMEMGRTERRKKYNIIIIDKFKCHSRHFKLPFKRSVCGWNEIVCITSFMVACLFRSGVYA